MSSGDDFTDAISRSGHPLEQRTQRACVDARMRVVANAPFRDPVTGKPRETDITATWVEARGPDLFHQRPGVGAELLIECVRTETPLVFFEKPATFAECGELGTLFGFPLWLSDPPGSSGYSRLEDLARVCWWKEGDPVATGWSGFEVKERPKGATKVVASQRHDIHGNLDKLVFRAHDAACRYMEPERIRVAFLRGWLYFVRPVLVVEGAVEAVTPSDDGFRREPRDVVRFVRATIVGDREARWPIDIVSESAFPAYLAALADRMGILKAFCVENRERVQSAIDCRSTLDLCAMLCPHPLRPSRGADAGPTVQPDGES